LKLKPYVTNAPLLNTATVTGEVQSPQEFARMGALKLPERDLLQTNRSELLENEQTLEETLPIDVSIDKTTVKERSVLEETPCIDISTGENIFKMQTDADLVLNTIDSGAQMMVKESHEKSTVASSRQENILIEIKRSDSKLPPANDEVAATYPNMQVLKQMPQEDSFSDLLELIHIEDERSSQKLLLKRFPYTDDEVQQLLKAYERHRGDWKEISKYVPGRTIRSVGYVPSLLFVMI
jgi:hypothetical protein